ncbi:type VI secretion system baseplate subunit TssG [uncultured Roseibium sp.]|uniref:type VI secretion system baseplate subunit TssG n=1 Tax=uncultured Roseibium sp. TaxID=1936171 RepID=UPI00262EB9DC|nr:type VI secretion system baseplate subunit TssG [uncultured Roseibium sp.]
MATEDRRKGDPMSGKDDKRARGKKNKQDRKAAADKTVVQIGAQKPADWQATTESTDVQHEGVKTLALEPVDLETPWPDTGPAQDEGIFPEETETPSDAAEEPVFNEPDKTVVNAKFPDVPEHQEEDREPEKQATSEDLPDIIKAETAEPFEATPDAQSDLETEPLPNEEPRIEVPVQQQYASLLAALSARIEKHPGGHDLLAVLRMLEGQTAPGAQAPAGMDPKKKVDEPAPPRIGKSRRSMEDIVRFGQDPSSEYAPSTIERATRDADGGLVLLERFLGMLGPHGALPAAYTDEAIMRGLRGEDSFPRFLDVFNNRFVQLFYRAWADARPIVQHDRPDDDRFLAYLGAPIGIGSPIFRDLDHIDDRLKLLYAGLTSSKTKSAARLKALITGVFGVDVEIDQCVGTWLHLDKDDQLSLGGFGPGGAGQLGADTIVGAKVYSVSDKIRIRIFTSSLEEYRKFLPPTRTKPNLWTEKLFDLIDFYLGLEIEYEIELALPRRCASAVQMNSSSSATLGHIGWLKPPPSDEPEEEEFEFEDEEMLTDTRFRPVRRHTTVYQ